MSIALIVTVASVAVIGATTLGLWMAASLRQRFDGGQAVTRIGTEPPCSDGASGYWFPTPVGAVCRAPKVGPNQTSTSAPSGARSEEHTHAVLQLLPDHVVAFFGVDLLSQIQMAPAGDDPDATRRQLATTLAASADGDRQPLEQLRSGFIRRLRRVSDDFAASAGLRVTEAALTLVPRAEEVWAPVQAGPASPRRRWWARRR